MYIYMRFGALRVYVALLCIRKRALQTLSLALAKRVGEIVYKHITAGHSRVAIENAARRVPATDGIIVN